MESVAVLPALSVAFAVIVRAVGSGPVAPKVHDVVPEARFHVDPPSRLTSTLLTPEPASEAVPEMVKVSVFRAAPLAGEEIWTEGFAKS